MAGFACTIWRRIPDSVCLFFYLFEMVTLFWFYFLILRLIRSLVSGKEFACFWCDWISTASWHCVETGVGVVFDGLYG